MWQGAFFMRMNPNRSRAGERQDGSDNPNTKEYWDRIQAQFNRPTFFSQGQMKKISLAVTAVVFGVVFAVEVVKWLDFFREMRGDPSLVADSGDPDGLKRICRSDIAPPDKSIDACSARIESGDLDTVETAKAYYNRGNAFRRSGQIARAIADYDRAIAMRPDYHDAYNNR